MTVYDIEKHREEEPKGTKLTASRLAEVEDVQKVMVKLSVRLNILAEEESNGWTPGTPQTNRTHRVEPIQALADQLTDGVEMLEKLYS